MTTWLGVDLARSLGNMVLLPMILHALSDREFLSRISDGFRVKEAMRVRSFQKFLALGVPGMHQFMFEWCAFGVLALLCCVFTDEMEAIIAIGANAIVFQRSTMIYMLYLGVSMAGNIRIRKALSAGGILCTKVACYLSLALAVLSSPY